MAGEPFTAESGPTAATLVELFTSEGCSSCPPAEKWLSRFKTDPGLWKTVVPAAFHVDYWDHLGWSDRFARSEFTERQRHYSAAWKSESVYTPGFAVNGTEWRGWFDGLPIPAHTSQAGVLRITLTPDYRLSASFTPDKASATGLMLEAVLIGNDRESAVTRGENSGRKLHHDFVVLELDGALMSFRDGQWNGAVKFRAGSEKPDAVAAWVVAGNDHQPIQATGGWIKAAP